MKLKFITPFIALLLLGCSASKSTSSASKIADDYGYSEKNPIKVGGVSDGPAMERKYLNRLTGPNGEAVTYERSGSCCHFESPNGFMGMGMLDIYVVKIEGDTIPKNLYLNMYDSGKQYAPKGFLLK